MFIHIGEDTVVSAEEIVGIFDMESTTVMKRTVEFLNNGEKMKKVINVSPFELPKSFIVCETPRGERIFISPVNVATIQKRIDNKTKRIKEFKKGK